MKQQRLFKVKRPRVQRRWKMHVADAGPAPDGSDRQFVRFDCGRCGRESDWMFCDTITEAKRGIPCPICNDDPNERPLFIPLIAKFYDAFADGSKSIEFRKHGPRWNATTCRVGRRVVLSRGYGKQNRLNGRVVFFETLWRKSADWIEVYKTAGDAACIHIETEPAE